LAAGELSSDRDKAATRFRESLLFLVIPPPEPIQHREVVSAIALMRSGVDFMKRALLIVVALSSAMLALMGSASARLGIAPMTTSNGAVIQVGGHGHGHHYGWHGGHGHHYGWHRGRGHHYGWRHHDRY
jgi:hypothetical protein